MSDRTLNKNSNGTGKTREKRVEEKIDKAVIRLKNSWLVPTMYRLLRILLDNNRPAEERIVAVVHLLELAKQNIMTLSQQDILPVFAMLAGFRFAAADESLGKIVESHFWRLVDAWHERNAKQRDAQHYAAGMYAAGCTDQSKAVNAVRHRFNLSNSVCKEVVEEATNAN